MSDSPRPSTPQPSDTGVPGSRKIKLSRTSSTVSSEQNDAKKYSPTETKSTIVDSVFSNFVAKKMEEIAKEKKSKEPCESDNVKEKKHHHKSKKSSKEKHKKHKHKDKDRDSEKIKDKHSNPEVSEESAEETTTTTDGFFAKESFLDVNNSGNNDSNSDNNNSSKSKKHKKHKKKHKHKHKSDKEKSKAKESSSKLLSFHDEMEPDPGCETKSEKTAKDSVEGGSNPVVEEKPRPKNIFADRFEKAIESKLSSLKENLTKKHKALEDLSKEELTIPEKKIKMMTEITLSEQYKKIKSEETAGKDISTSLNEGKGKEDTQVCSALSEHLRKREQVVKAKTEPSMTDASKGRTIVSLFITIKQNFPVMIIIISFLMLHLLCVPQKI